eukprot:7380175-Alexandrium_andersonii.AAC.1
MGGSAPRSCMGACCEGFGAGLLPTMFPPAGALFHRCHRTRHANRAERTPRELREAIERLILGPRSSSSEGLESFCTLERLSSPGTHGETVR